MPLVQAVCSVLIQLVNVLAILAIQAPHVIRVPPTTIEQVMELVQVSVIIYQSKTDQDILQLYFIFSLRL